MFTLISEAHKNAPRSCLFAENPNRLVTLWDLMQQFYPGNFCGLFASFGILEQVASTSEPRSFVPEAWVTQATLSILMPVSFICVQLELSESLKLVKRLTKECESRIRVEAFQHGLEHLRELMKSEMSEHKYFQIRKSVAGLYDAVYPMGEDVYDAFPSARLNLTEAGKCMACDLNNAAMHHLMLACEIGLRELGKDRQIPSSLTGDIEFKQWGQIIGEIEGEVKKIQSWSNSHVKDEAHRFYNATLCELRSFNDGYRRHLAHARDFEFTGPDALGLWDHVSRFLHMLRTKISEDNYTPKIWV